MTSGWSLPWEAPWFDPLAGWGRGLPAPDAAGTFPDDLPDALNRLGPLPVRFVPQSALPDGMAYEQFIFDTGSVPTRTNLHDAFNGLCWHRFPQTKLGLNRLQAAEIARAGVGAVRGPLRDALTLFDENAALLQAPPELWEALLARDWQRLFLDQRGLWAQSRLVVFGHALLEKLVSPYKSITAHVLRWPVPPELGADLSAWDAWLAQAVSADRLQAKPFTPLPVLGMPGWWPANADPAFYADTTVFRPPRA